MSTAEPTPAPQPDPLADEPVDLDNGVKKALNLWALTQVAHEGMMLDKIGKQTKRVLQLADAARTGKTAASDSQPDGEDMGVSIGNEKREYHYHYAPQQQDSSVKSLMPSANTLGTVGKVLAAAGIGVGGLLAYQNYMKPDTQPPAGNVTINGHDYQLGIKVKD